MHHVIRVKRRDGGRNYCRRTAKHLLGEQCGAPYRPRADQRLSKHDWNKHLLAECHCGKNCQIQRNPRRSRRAVTKCNAIPSGNILSEVEKTRSYLPKSPQRPSNSERRRAQRKVQK
jgi:hypothetical protein